jgi:hypothetical protein
MIGHIEDDCIKKLMATVEKLGHSKDGKASSSSIMANCKGNLTNLRRL